MIITLSQSHPLLRITAKIREIGVKVHQKFHQRQHFVELSKKKTRCYKQYIHVLPAVKYATFNPFLIYIFLDKITANHL